MAHVGLSTSPPSVQSIPELFLAALLEGIIQFPEFLRKLEFFIKTVNRVVYLFLRSLFRQLLLLLLSPPLPLAHW